MLAVLRDCGALAALLPEVDALFGVAQPPAHHPEIDTGVHVLQALDWAAAHDCAAAGALCRAHARPRQGTVAGGGAAATHRARAAQRAHRADALSQRLRVPAGLPRRRARSRRAGTASSIAPRELRPATLLDLLVRRRCAAASRAPRRAARGVRRRRVLATGRGAGLRARAARCATRSPSSSASMRARSRADGRGKRGRRCRRGRCDRDGGARARGCALRVEALRQSSRRRC